MALSAQRGDKLRVRRGAAALGDAPAAVAAWLRACMAADGDRLFLWTPVLIATGVAAYFAVDFEPPLVGAMAAAAALALAFIPLRRRAAAAPLAAGLLCVALGFGAASLRNHLVAGPVLEKPQAGHLTGRVVAAEETETGGLVAVLEPSSFARLAADELPRRVRVNIRLKEASLAPGATVSLRARLMPPPEPVLPDGFDYARQVWFESLGGVGFAYTAPEELEPPDGWASMLAELRGRIGVRIRHVIGGPAGAVSAALVTGERAAIPKAVAADLRAAGLAHVLAISGLHMMLFGGSVFWLVRAGLALVPRLALNYPIKKWAAAAALASGFFYLILSGGGWSARRAFIMTAIIFAAILVDRRALSLRNVAIAAVIILLTTPEALFNPGFQMSFAAVAALIAAYEWWGARTEPGRDFSWSTKAKRYAIVLAVTDTIAATATAPYSLFHFNRVALYSLPANVAAMPLMGFFIVPFAVIALALTPFGLDAWAWRLAALGMDWVLAIASWASGLPGAVSTTPQWPQGAMLALTFGGLWLCLSRAPWRLAGLAAIPLAWILIAQARPPVLFVSPSGLNAGVVASNGEGGKALHVYAARRERFAAELWEEAAGLDPDAVRPSAMAAIFACDASGCAGAVTDQGSAIVAVTTDKAALAEDCQRADIVVALFPASAGDWRACKAFLIDRRSVWRRGAHAAWIEKDGALVVKTANEERGARPWTGD